MVGWLALVHEEQVPCLRVSRVVLVPSLLHELPFLVLPPRLLVPSRGSRGHTTSSSSYTAVRMTEDYGVMVGAEALTPTPLLSSTLASRLSSAATLAWPS